VPLVTSAVAMVSSKPRRCRTLTVLHPLRHPSPQHRLPLHATSLDSRRYQAARRRRLLWTSSTSHRLQLTVTRVSAATSTVTSLPCLKVSGGRTLQLLWPHHHSKPQAGVDEAAEVPPPPPLLLQQLVQPLLQQPLQQPPLQQLPLQPLLQQPL
jgi:hypothetical protein